jgi:small-conductance mechanosensitive channel
VVDVETLQRENAQLREQFARVVESNQTLTEQIAKLNVRITELLAIAQRRQRKPALRNHPLHRPRLPVKPSKPSMSARSRRRSPPRRSARRHV